MCTSIGFEYRELRCIQKFIAYAYFRFEWVQTIITKALKRTDDPVISE